MTNTPQHSFDQDNGYRVEAKKSLVTFWIGNYREGGSKTVSFQDFLKEMPSHWMSMADYSGKAPEKVKGHYESVCQYIRGNTKREQNLKDSKLDPEARAWLSIGQE